MIINFLPLTEIRLVLPESFFFVIDIIEEVRQSAQFKAGARSTGEEWARGKRRNNTKDRLCALYN